jgi:hypothetical protein
VTHGAAGEGAGETGALVGIWEKAGGEPCSSPYPDELELLAGGRYAGRKHEGAREHPIWDVGSYEVVGEGRVIVSTSYDARRTYEYSLADDVLTFLDEDGCRFEYRRRA